MTARRPAGAYLHAERVVGTPDEKLAIGDLLEMALQAQVRIANTEQLRIDGPVDIVASRAAFAQGIVFEGVGTTLGRMATEAAFIRGEQRGATADDNGAFVGRMAGGARKPPLRNGMMAGQVELPAHV